MDVLLIPVFILFSLLVPVLALALLLYGIPVQAEATLIHKANRQEQIVAISWGIFAIRTSGAGGTRVIDLLILDHAVVSHAGPMETVETGDAGAGESIPDRARGPASALQIDELVHIVQRMIGPVGTFGSEFWHESRFVDARGTVTLGLGDPALTGEACGFYWASRFLLQSARIYIELEPVFDRAVLELDITVRVRVGHPLRILVAGIDLAREPVVKDAMEFLKRQDAGVAGT
ncbi:MAG: DUF2953 domain-containing protein [Methanoregula sp.]|nr:DUF2953 domain-containing protein [Methanoregula sp.]